jgi:hypothetical protein
MAILDTLLALLRQIPMAIRALTTMGYDGPSHSIPRTQTIPKIIFVRMTFTELYDTSENFVT